MSPLPYCLLACRPRSVLIRSRRLVVCVPFFALFCSPVSRPGFSRFFVFACLLRPSSALPVDDPVYGTRRCGETLHDETGDETLPPYEMTKRDDEPGGAMMPLLA